MKRALSSTMVTALVFAGQVSAAQSRGAQAPRPEPAVRQPANRAPSNIVDNAAVVKMVKAGLGEQIIVAAILSAMERRFDLSPDGLIVLKSAAVSDAIIAAMQRSVAAVDAPAAPREPAANSTSPGASPARPAAELTVKDAQLVAGTEVRLQLVTPGVASNTVKVDQPLQFNVADDIVVGGVTVIRRGTTAWGKVTKVTAQLLTRAGVLEFSIDSVKAINGQEIDLRSAQSISGGRGLIRGNEVTIAEGATFAATIERDVTVTVSTAGGPTDSTARILPEPGNSAGAASPVPVSSGSATVATLQRRELKNGDPATIVVSLSEAEASAKVKSYFNSKNSDFNVNIDTGRINSDWYGNRRCGPGIQHCENRASIRINSEDGQTTIRIQVFERKREGGLSSKPWNENSTSQGKETMELAVELEAALRR